MGYSVTVALRHSARKDGTCQVRLVVTIDRRVLQLSLGIAWPLALFDEAEGVCLASRPPRARPAGYAEQLAAAQVRAGGAEALAQLADDYSLLIGKARAKANTIFVEYRLSGQVLTREKFLLDYQSEGSKKDFVSYFYHKVLERHRKKKIGDITKKNHLSTWRALKAFREEIPFHTLGPDFADDFKLYLDKTVRGLNTRWTRHKDVKTYLAIARREKIKFENPYEDFKVATEPGKWKPVPPDELRRLEAYYERCAPGTAPRRILCKFLFSCKCGLRLSDLKNIGNSKLEGNRLTYEMQKGWSKRLRASLLPLTRQALAYLQDAHAEEGTGKFADYTDQYENRVLKTIGQQLDIETHLHHHVGRETFATEFIRHGGTVQVLQKLLGHSKITTTMKYVHVDEQMMTEAIAALDAKEAA